MNRTKKQHYISQSILNVFFGTTKIKEYNLINSKSNGYGTTTENSMCCSDIYECDFYDDNKLENVFAVLYDGQFASVLDRINKELNVNNINEAKKILGSNYYFYILSYYKSLASLIRLSSNDKHKLDKNLSTKKMFNLITNVKYMERLSLILNNCYKVYFIQSPEDNFIICDQFISTASNYFNGAFSNISNRDIGVKGSIVFLPISKKYYAMLIDKNFSVDYLTDDINILSIELNKKINNIIYNNATEKVATVRDYQYEFKNINSFGDEEVFIVYSRNTRAWKKKKEIFFTNYEQDIYDMYFKFDWANNKNLGKNDKCFCGSGKKYKHCCYDKVQRCFLIINNMKNKSIHDKVLIDKNLGLEESVEL